MTLPAGLGRVALGLVLTVTTVAAAPQSDRVLKGYFERYRAGERSAVLAEIAALGAFDRQARQLADRAADWIPSDSPDADRDRLFVATFLLDVAAARLETDWLTVRGLVEVGCRLVDRTDRDHPLGLTWHLAALALAEGAADTRFLITTDRSPGPERFDHLAHSRSRYPEEARFRLAEVVVPEMGQTDLAPPRDRPWRSDDELRRTQVGGAMELAMRRQRRRALDRFQSLTAIPSIASEAHLRSAYLAYQLNDDDAALAHLRAAQGDPSDPFVTYVGHLLMASIHMRRQAFPAAEASLEQALSVVPGAQSATQMLAARRFLTGRSDEAYALVETHFTRQREVTDPWRLFGYGDFRRLGDLLRRLEQGLRG